MTQYHPGNDDVDGKHDLMMVMMMCFCACAGIYWGATAVALAGGLDRMDRESIIAFVRSCWRPDVGGYAAAPGHDAHVLYTLSAVQLLSLFAAEEDVQVDALVGFVQRLQV